jgi:hypothetical protein
MSHLKEEEANCVSLSKSPFNLVSIELTFELLAISTIIYAGPIPIHGKN